MAVKTTVISQSERLHTLYRNKARKKLIELMYNCRGQNGEYILKVAEVQFPIIEEYIQKSLGLYDTKSN